MRRENQLLFGLKIDKIVTVGFICKRKEVNEQKIEMKPQSQLKLAPNAVDFQPISS